MGSDTCTVDYEGIGINSRTSNSKAAASELSSIFQNHYPEFLVRAPHPFPRLSSSFLILGAQVLRQRTGPHDLDILALQARPVPRNPRQDESRRQRPTEDWQGPLTTHRCQGTSGAVWWRGEGRLVISLSGSASVFCLFAWLV
jgi:hypothetical protein